VSNFFKKPQLSSSVGIYSVSEMSDSYDYVSFNDSMKNCLILPCNEDFVAVEIIHSAYNMLLYL